MLGGLSSRLTINLFGWPNLYQSNHNFHEYSNQILTIIKYEAEILQYIE